MRRLFFLAAALLALAVPATAQLWNAARSSFSVKIAETVFDNSGAPWPFFSTINAENYDQGGAEIAYHVPNIGAPNCNPVNGQSYRPDFVNLTTSTDGPAFQVGCNSSGGVFGTGNWYKYTVNISQVGPYVINLRVANGQSGGSWAFAIDGTTIGSTSVPNTGNWSTFTTIQSPQFNTNLGNHVIQLTGTNSTSGNSAGDISSFTGGTNINTGVTPAAAASAGFTQHILHVDFTDSFYGTLSNWIKQCGANPTSPGPGAHAFFWATWMGVGNSAGNPCDGSHIVQVNDGGTLGMQFRVNPNEQCPGADATHGCSSGVFTPGTVVESSDGTSGSFNCSANGSACFNFFYAEIVARSVQFSGPNTQSVASGCGGCAAALQDFWRDGGNPEIDGWETSANGAGNLGDMLHSDQGLNAGAGMMETLYPGLNTTTQYVKVGFRYQSTGQFSSGQCQNNGDFSHASISVYAHQNINADFTAAEQNGTNVCLSQREILGQGAGWAFQILNQIGNQQIFGNTDSVFIVKRADVWTCTQWSVTNQLPAGCFSPSFQGSP